MHLALAALTLLLASAGCGVRAAVITADPVVPLVASAARGRAALVIASAAASEAGVDVGAALVTPALEASLSCGCATTTWLSPHAVLRVSPDASALGGAMRALRRATSAADDECSASCEAAAQPAGFVADAAASGRVSARVWARRFEYCELLELLAPGALTVLLHAPAPLQHARLPLADAAALALPPPVSGGSRALALCALRRMRLPSTASTTGAAGAVLRTGGGEGGMGGGAS